MLTPFNFKMWNHDGQQYQVIAIEDDYEAIMHGINHGLDVFENKNELTLVYGAGDDFESNVERLKRYGIALESDGIHLSYKRLKH